MRNKALGSLRLHPPGEKAVRSAPSIYLEGSGAILAPSPASKTRRYPNFSVKRENLPFQFTDLAVLIDFPRLLCYINQRRPGDGIGRRAWLRAMWEFSCAGSNPAPGISGNGPIGPLFLPVGYSRTRLNGTLDSARRSGIIRPNILVYRGRPS